jgi:hypothetical protein
MDSLFHFVFPIMSALAARVKIKHKVRTLIVLASLTVLMDVDHFVGGLERAGLHNVFVAILIPLILLYISLHFRMSRYVKTFFFLLLIFLSSHVFLDLFSNPSFGDGIGIVTGYGVQLFYPLSTTQYAVNFNLKIPMIISTHPDVTEGYIVSSIGFGILMYFIIIVVPCLFLDDIIEISERKHEKFRKAAREFFRNLQKD